MPYLFWNIFLAVVGAVFGLFVGRNRLKSDRYCTLVSTYVLSGLVLIFGVDITAAARHWFVPYIVPEWICYVGAYLYVFFRTAPREGSN